MGPEINLGEVPYRMEYANQVPAGAVIWDQDWGFCIRMDLTSFEILFDGMPGTVWFLILEKNEINPHNNRQGQFFGLGSHEIVRLTDLSMNQMLQLFTANIATVVQVRG